MKPDLSEFTIVESDGLLSVKNPPDGSTSYQADYLARLHPATSEDVRDFHALTERYYDKLVTDQFPDIAESRRQWKARQRR